MAKLSKNGKRIGRPPKGEQEPVKLKGFSEEQIRKAKASYALYIPIRPFNCDTKTMHIVSFCWYNPDYIG